MSHQANINIAEAKMDMESEEGWDAHHSGREDYIQELDQVIINSIIDD